jgi:lauroyl/myristoyl acyltransferase
VEFVGQHAPLSFAFGQLAQRTGAALLPAVTYSTGPLGFEIAVSRLAQVDTRADLDELSTTMAKPLEELVQRDPGQWYGITRLFRRAEREAADE